MPEPFRRGRIKHHIGVHAEFGIHVVLTVPREFSANSDSAWQSAVVAKVFVYTRQFSFCFAALVQIHGEHTSASGTAKRGVEGAVVEDYEIARVGFQRNIAGNL